MYDDQLCMYLSGATRTAKCRQKKSDYEKEETNESKAGNAGIKETEERNACFRRRDSDRFEDNFRERRQHPITRKNVRRVVRYDKETRTAEELIYWQMKSVEMVVHESFRVFIIGKNVVMYIMRMMTMIMK